ncbi:hypothetical protein [Butyrivibrio sp. INlla16]|uniref:hypothetical protein n=1 Tax=Butyrivibrio sp. INlla16 TaxID=1520807 RepID=UPI001479B758|nr:hypothetical protein [Butyrivibrio sp. INlla16]
MKVEYEVQVSGVGLPIEQDSGGLSDAARLYAAAYHLVALAFAIAIIKGNPVRS